MVVSVAERMVNVQQQEIPTEVQPMIPFLDWVKTQQGEVYEQVLGAVATISMVLENRLLIETPTFRGPDLWVMRDAAVTLKQMAQAAGFADAAMFCAGTEEYATTSIAVLEAVVGKLDEW